MRLLGSPVAPLIRRNPVGHLVNIGQLIDEIVQIGADARFRLRRLDGGRRLAGRLVYFVDVGYAALVHRLWFGEHTVLRENATWLPPDEDLCFGKAGEGGGMEEVVVVACVAVAGDGACACVGG